MIQTVTLRYTRGFGYISLYVRAWTCQIIQTGDLKQAVVELFFPDYIHCSCKVERSSKIVLHNEYYVMFKTRATVFYRDLKPRGAAE